MPNDVMLDVMAAGAEAQVRFRRQPLGPGFGPPTKTPQIRGSAWVPKNTQCSSRMGNWFGVMESLQLLSAEPVGRPLSPLSDARF